MIFHKILKCLFWFLFGTLNGELWQVLTTHDSIGVVGEGEGWGDMCVFKFETSYIICHLSNYWPQCNAGNAMEKSLVELLKCTWGRERLQHSAKADIR